MISENDKKILLALARGTLEEFVKQHRMPTFQDLGTTLNPLLEEQRGVFVTLYRYTSAVTKTLRGCIGTIQPVQPLYQAVMNNTVNACARDNRFTPVNEGELQELCLEINVLTLPHAVASYHDIQLGRDGIIFNQGMNRSVFLPSVPLEFGWSLPETLSQLALKAGLSKDAWKMEETHFEVFQAEAFSEAIF